MNAPDSTPLLDRSPLVRWIRWLFSWRGIRRILIVMAWVVTILALFYGEEHWRGSRAWNKYRRQLEARGEQLDFQALIPKAVPDDQNFAAIPLIQSWFENLSSPEYQKRWEDNYTRASMWLFVGKKKGEPTTRRLTDLVSWQMAFEALRTGQPDSGKEFGPGPLDRESRAKAAPGVLAGLKGNEEMVAELRAASHRPYVRYPVNYEVENPWAILIPHMGRIRAICQRLELRVCAELASGENQSAFEDLKRSYVHWVPGTGGLSGNGNPIHLGRARGASMVRVPTA